MKSFTRVITILVFIFLYIPMIILAIASFSTGKDIAVFEGFTFHQYRELFRDDGLVSLLTNSLIIAVISTLSATILGTVASLGIYKSRGRLRSAIMTQTNIPLTNPDLTEAALDLGCTPVQAFFKVVLHEIMPGIISGALMAFTMSLDDFVISYFVTGSGFVTLPVEIYSYTKKPIHPKVYALFTLIFLVMLILMVTMNLLQARDNTRRRKLMLRRNGR